MVTYPNARLRQSGALVLRGALAPVEAHQRLRPAPLLGHVVHVLLEVHVEVLEHLVAETEVGHLEVMKWSGEGQESDAGQLEVMKSFYAYVGQLEVMKRA